MKKEVEGFLHHDENSVRIIYERYFGLLKHQAFSILRNETEAENIA